MAQRLPIDWTDTSKGGRKEWTQRCARSIECQLCEVHQNRTHHKRVTDYCHFLSILLPISCQPLFFIISLLPAFVSITTVPTWKRDSLTFFCMNRNPNKKCHAWNNMNTFSIFHADSGKRMWGFFFQKLHTISWRYRTMEFNLDSNSTLWDPKEFVCYTESKGAKNTKKQSQTHTHQYNSLCPTRISNVSSQLAIRVTVSLLCQFHLIQFECTCKNIHNKENNLDLIFSIYLLKIEKRKYDERMLLESLILVWMTAFSFLINFFSLFFNDSTEINALCPMHVQSK